jgi:hypothetical protein
LPDEGRGRESLVEWGSPVAAAEGEKSAETRAESLRQKDRGPEGVLESPILELDRRRRGNTLRFGTGRKK